MYNIAWSFYELKNEEKFILSFERLLGAFPQSEFAPDARFTLGDFYFNKEDYKKALVEYQHVVRDYPDAKVAREVPEVLGNVQEIVAYNEYEQVIAVFSEAVALDKEGKSEQATQKFEALIPQLKELMEKYPATEVEVGALSNLGVCYEFMRRWNEAVQTYDKVIALFEQDKASEEAFKFAKGHRDWIVSTRL
jgi:TolA-binding protein